MTALLMLEPRDAGTLDFEPTVQFSAVMNEGHFIPECPYTAGCYENTTACPRTY